MGSYKCRSLKIRMEFEIANIFLFVKCVVRVVNHHATLFRWFFLFCVFLLLSSSFFSCSLRLFAAAKNAAPGASFSSFLSSLLLSKYCACASI